MKITNHLKHEAFAIEHNMAVDNPKPGIERAIVGMIKSLEEYARAYRRSWDSPIGEDYVLGADGFKPMVEGLRVLLNGDSGRLDCGTIDGYLLKLCADNAVELDK